MDDPLDGSGFFPLPAERLGDDGGDDDDRLDDEDTDGVFVVGMFARISVDDRITA